MQYKYRYKKITTSQGKNKCTVKYSNSLNKACNKDNIKQKDQVQKAETSVYHQNKICHLTTKQVEQVSAVR